MGVPPSSRTGIARSNSAAATAREPGSRYKAIYSTQSTVGSPIARHPTPGKPPTPVPSLRLNDFPPLPASSNHKVPRTVEDEGRRRVPKCARFLDRSLPNPAAWDSRPSALLVKGVRPYPEVVKAIKEGVDPGEFSDNVHLNKSRKRDLLIRFTNSQSIGDEIKKMKSKLSDMGPGVIRNVSTLGRLDSLLILDIDPSITKEELLEALRKITPAKIRDNIKINDQL